MSYLHNAVFKGDLPTVKNLIETQGYSPNYTGITGWNDTPLTLAARFGHRSVMDYLIQKGADVNGRGFYFSMGETPFEAAFSAHQTQAIVTLLTNPATTLSNHLDKTSIANQCLLQAASKNDAWSIDKLLKHTEADINVHDKFMHRTPLHNAVMTDSLDATFKLLEKGAKVNAVDVHGWTALHYAASNGDMQFATLLIKEGAKVNALDYNDSTPLFFAAGSSEEELVNLLVERGAKVNQVNKDERSALDLAIINDDADMVKCLVENGAKIGANIHNTTPLENAAESGKLQALETLIELGSKLEHKNADGNTALELAFKAGQMGALNILAMHGAFVPRYIQDKLDKMKIVEVEDVLPGDQVVTSPSSDAETTQPTLTQQVENNTPAETTYAQPIGPMLPNIEQHYDVVAVMA